MTPYTFHITLYDVAFVGMIFIGLNFALLLAFTKSINRIANRFLALALLTMILWMIRILAIDIRLETYLPGWDRLPMQFLLALGPLMYFYVLKITRRDYKFSWKDLLHFSPILLEQAVLTLEIGQSTAAGVATYATPIFHQLDPVLQLLIFISIITYLYRSHKLIQNFYRRLQPVLMDRSLLEFRWLRRLLAATALLWLLWIVYAAVDYFGYRDQLAIHLYYPFYIFFVVILIWTAAAAFLRPQAGMIAQQSPALKPAAPTELRAKGAWLRKTMEANLYYQDPELSLGSLAEKLELTSHELSRLINTVHKKSFNDFINEYRVRDVAAKMLDSAYDHITLLGIAYGSGFNSKATFNRIFKQMTGKSPVEYKTHFKKEVSSYNLRRNPQFAAIISNQQTIHQWSDEKSSRNVMFKNYLKVAWRNLIRNKAHSLINISGLAVGIACSLLIMLWVQNELSMDAWHKNGPRTYIVYERTFADHKYTGSYGTPALTADEMKKVVPDVQYATQLSWNVWKTFQVGEKIVKKEGSFASADYFKIFDMPLLRGNAKSALKTVSSIAISHKMADQFYGSPGAAIGKSIRFENQKNFIVSAVFEDLPKTSSKKFEYLINWDEFMEENSWAKDWGNQGPQTFVMLRSDANAAAAEKKITHFLDNYNKYQKKGVYSVELGLQPYNDIYLHGSFTADKISGGRIEYVNLFSIVAIFILLIACINFMNLSTARSVKRAREIGVRKVVGAERSALVKQFFGESMLITAIAVAFSLILLVALLPAFNEATQKQIDLPFGETGFWIKLIAIMLVTGLVSGSYPALFLSSFNPVKVLKGTLRLGSGVTFFRKALVVFQFVLSTVLIIGTIIVSKQVNYIQTINLGYDRENLVYVFLDGDLKTKYEVFKNEALGQPGIQSITRMSEAPTEISNGTGGVDWVGKDPNDNPSFTQASVGYDFVRTMKLKIISGRDYSKDFRTDSVGYLVNEAALKRIGYKKPVGQPLTFWGKKGTIIGVLKDFHFASLHEQIEPLILRLDENEGIGFALIRTKPGQTKQALASLEAICKDLNPNFQFNYNFSDDEYQKLYQNEQVVGKLSNAFAFLAIFISCLGLLGLAMFTAEQRFKEIGIRKVLGASVASLFSSLSREFITLVVIALLIATPLSYYAMDKWLMDYQYRTDMSWWVFAAAGVSAMIISLITVSFQTIRAALVSPVKSLRSE